MEKRKLIPLVDGYPCPYCGGEDVREDGLAHNVGAEYGAYCTDCGIEYWEYPEDNEAHWVFPDEPSTVYVDALDRY